MSVAAPRLAEAPPQELRRFLLALCQPAGVYEVRIPKHNKYGQTASGYFDDPETLLRATSKWDGRANLYITLNPVQPALLARAANRIADRADKTTTDAEIVRRDWLLVDVDPIRPGGISSTDEELAWAYEVLAKTVAFLREQGWPEPITAMSGNGYYALYRVDLANDAASLELVRNVLVALAGKFDTEQARIDTTVSNAARLVGLVGTKKVKGDPLPERPHRRSRLETTPDKLLPVSPEQLAAVAGPATGRKGFDAEYSSLARQLDERGIEYREQPADSQGFVWYHVRQCPFHDDGRPFECGVGQKLPDGPFAGKCFHPEGDGKSWREWKLALGLAATSGEGASDRARSRGGAGPSGQDDDGVPGWRADISDGAAHGLYHGDKRALPEALVPIEILEGDGAPAGAFVRVHFVGQGSREVFMPADAVTSRDPAAVLYDSTGIAWTPESAKPVRTWLADVLTRTPHIQRAQALIKPRWEGERPLLPGGDLRLLPARNAGWLAAYGKVAAVKGGEARTAWQAVLSKASRHPRLLTVLGGAAISVYLEPLKRGPFIVHICGDSRRGKTMGMRVSMSAFGNPDLLVRTWNSTRIAAIERLATANILPVALDETATAGMKDELMEAIVFGASTGVGRSRSGRGGGLREEQAWHLAILSTGERRLTNVSGLTGAQARVLQIQAPLTPTAAAIDEIHELAQTHFGWPLAWLRDQGDAFLDLVRADVSVAEEVLTDVATNPVARTLARHLACCAAGVRALSFWCRADFPLDDALGAAEEVLREVENGLEEEGPSAADRLIGAIFEAEARRDWAFPMRGQIDDDKRKVELDGLKLGDELAVFPTALRRIAGDIGLADYYAALRELHDRGGLKPAEDGKHLTQVVRAQNGRLTRVYVFPRPEQKVDDDG